MSHRQSKRKRSGLLPKDESPLKLVPSEKRRFWDQIPGEPTIETATRYREKWTDDEVRRLVSADPVTESYESLARELGRSPGALRIRRSQMIHILRGEPYAMEFVESTDHKRADWRQVNKVLQEMGILDLPVTEQFRLAVHLQQPSASYRGDFTQTVLKEKKAKRLRLVEEVRTIRGGAHDA
jgi:hypothetical protein